MTLLVDQDSDADRALLLEPSRPTSTDDERAVETQARRLENALRSFRVEATVVAAKVGVASSKSSSSPQSREARATHAEPRRGSTIEQRGESRANQAKLQKAAYSPT